MELEQLVELAKQGDRSALEEVVLRIQDRVYGLAMRMLWRPADAEDATQEILIRILTHLGTFRNESAFTTWVYQVASNYLLSTRKRLAEREEITFEDFGKQLEEGLKQRPLLEESSIDRELMIQEIKIGCTHGMLLCLDREHRLAYILGDILELSSQEGAEVVGITRTSFRKRLSRARNRIRKFMNHHCGIVNTKNSCRCAKRIAFAIRSGRVDPDDLLFAEHPVRTTKEITIQQIRRLHELQRCTALYRSHPEYAAPQSLVQKLRDLIFVQSKSLSKM
ncbi:RNA polymerase sigma factor [bacterium]|nr:RNA polymerase sigma factor [bacterium]MCI0603608.1 RNA polymerase sigma factor [bacterium]